MVWQFVLSNVHVLVHYPALHHVFFITRLAYIVSIFKFLLRFFAKKPLPWQGKGDVMENAKPPCGGFASEVFYVRPWGPTQLPLKGCL